MWTPGERKACINLTAATLTWYSIEYCIKGNVNVCLIFPNLPDGFETGTIKTLSLIIFVGMLGQVMFVFRLSNTAVYLSNLLAQQMATYVI